jgi:anti-anti-sigma factor
MINSVEMLERGDHVVLYPKGYLNGPLGARIDQACADLILKGRDRVIINFSQIETMNTMGVASLVSILEKVSRNNGMICFTDLLPTNKQLLDVLDISRAVLIFDSEDQALAHIDNAVAFDIREAEAASRAQTEPQDSIPEETEPVSQAEDEPSDPAGKGPDEEVHPEIMPAPDPDADTPPRW